jgi:hypothetical protein
MVALVEAANLDAIPAGATSLHAWLAPARTQLPEVVRRHREGA